MQRSMTEAKEISLLDEISIDSVVPLGLKYGVIGSAELSFLVIFDIATKQLVSTISLGNVTKPIFACTPDNKIICQHADGYIRTWSILSGAKPVCTGASDITGRIKSIVSIGQNQFITLESHGKSQSIICYWNIPPIDRKPAELKPASAIPIRESCSEIRQHLCYDNKIIFIGDKLYIFNLISKQMKTSGFMRCMIADAFCFYNGTVVGVLTHHASMGGANFRRFQFFDINTLTLLRNGVDLPGEPTACYNSVAVLGKHDIAVGCSDRSSSSAVKIYNFSDLQSPKLLREHIVPAENIHRLAVDEHGNILVASSKGLHYIEQYPTKELASSDVSDLQFKM